MINRCFFFMIYILALSHCHVMAKELFTKSRYIVDELGNRVKLTCVTWPAHLESMIAEGLADQAMDTISKQIVSMGFNCVRLTWALELVTNNIIRVTTVRQMLQKLDLNEAFDGIQTNNPSIVDLSLPNTFKELVRVLGRNNLMVILDNQITKPGWCCQNHDGNGFFGDRYFDPITWLRGLSEMASLFNSDHNVVAMSLRHQLRGPKQNLPDYYRYMQEGAELINSENPNVLVIFSGLHYDTDLTFLHERDVMLTFPNKLVFEAQWFARTDRDIWTTRGHKHICRHMLKKKAESVMFVSQKLGFPLFMSEFGMNMNNLSVGDNHYMNCFLLAAKMFDFDWSLWTLNGNYYLKHDRKWVDEPFGILSKDWSQPRSKSFVKKLSTIQ